MNIRKLVFALIFLAFAASILLMSFASALCDESQTILKLFSQNNTHAEVYNGANYQIEICYDEIFNKNYNLSNPHACTGNNKLIGLYSQTNSHVENPALNNYLVQVCYGDLVCRLATGCGANEKVIASLSAETNAHVAIGSFYSRRLCCSSAFALQNQTNGTIPENKTGTIIVEKQTIPDSQDYFVFIGDANGIIKDNQQIIVSNLTPGVYSSTELVPAGWNLTSIVCSDNNSFGNIANAAVTFNLEADETVRCIFTNLLVNGTNQSLFVRFESPQNITYTNPEILIDIKSNGQNVWFNTNGRANESYGAPIFRTFANGTYTLTAHANNSTDEMSASVTFSVLLSNGTGGNQTNGGDDDNNDDEDDDDKEKGIIYFNENALTDKGFRGNLTSANYTFDEPIQLESKTSRGLLDFLGSMGLLYVLLALITIALLIIIMFAALK